MKTHPAFDPLNLSDGRPFVLTPEYLHTQYTLQAESVYDWHTAVIREAFGSGYRFYSAEERTPECLFVSDPERGLGFWMAPTPGAVNVSVLSNGFEHPAMDAASFGMAVTLMVVNHFGWYLADGADQGTPQYNVAQHMSDLYLGLRSWAFDLSEQGYLDGEAIAGFID